MKIVLASQNQKKLQELRPEFLRFGLDVVSQTELGIFEGADETGSTYEENAELKARFIMNATGFPAIADDSGLMADALNGAPGVHSHRFGNVDSDEARCRFLLEKMQDVPDDKRTAHFVCVITMLFPDGRKLTARGECSGVILRRFRGANGFGYDPLFYVPDQKKTFAELTEDEKGAISHRGRALRSFLKQYEEMIRHFNE